MTGGGTPAVSACAVGGTLSAGESCSHGSQGNSFTFTVRNDGTGCVGGIFSGNRVTNKNFSARRNADGQWEIVALPGIAAMQPDDVTVTLPGAMAWQRVRSPSRRRRPRSTAMSWSRVRLAARGLRPHGGARRHGLTIRGVNLVL